jgi:hypothetical protein
LAERHGRATLIEGRIEDYDPQAPGISAALAHIRTEIKAGT